ncbi:hypothetical protein CPB85DRAFT_1556995 [Mucidula mucida]|nr:hypothetical protein CPB85DRAFT_1556995 [Mucidula mucida]
MSAITIDDTFGAMFWGFTVTMMIYGITVLQAYFYYMTYPDDRKSLKLLVASILTLDTIHVVFICHAMHHYLITGFATHAVLLDGIWCVSSPESYDHIMLTCYRSLYSSILINIIIAFIVQWSASSHAIHHFAYSDYSSFFTKRIHYLCPERFRWWMSSVIGFVVVAHFAFGLETVTQLYEHSFLFGYYLLDSPLSFFSFLIKTFSQLKQVNFVAVLPFAVTAILSDIFIADTNYLISTLVGYAITRCLLTSLIAVVEVVVFVILPDSFYSFAIDFVIGKLWANSLLASLNSRRSLRDRPKKSSGTSSGDISTSFRVATRSQQNSTAFEHGQISLVRINRSEDETGPSDEAESSYNVVQSSLSARVAVFLK